MKTLLLTGQPLTIADVVEVACHARPVALGAAGAARMAAARRLVEDTMYGEKAVYGINTGFGSLSRIRIPADQLTELQHNLLRSHAAGVGEPLPAPVVRALLLLTAASLARGYSGVRPLVVERLCALLRAGVHPVIPSRGSVGASGDLAPLAHLALLLIGEGQAVLGERHERYTSADQRGTAPLVAGRAALEQVGLAPIALEPKEGLALINGTHLMAGYGALLVRESETLLHAAELAVAMSLEAMRGTATPWDARIHALRPQHGQAAVAERLRALAAGSAILVSHADCGRVQDPYSLRCAPQVLGAVSDGIAFARTLVERELGAVTDNPLCFPDDAAVLSGGNFHGQPLALALDLLGIVLTQLAGFAERRIYLLVSAPDPAMGLPAFLTAHSGLNSGLMVAQYTAAALVNECQVLATPASVHSIPTSAGMEDFNSMGATAAHKAAQILAHARSVVAIELLCAAQGLEFQRPLRAGPLVEAAHARIREVVPPFDGDRVVSDAIMALERLIAEGAFVP
jgi:histidine ammonia-lyase